VRGRTAIEANWARELATASFLGIGRDVEDFVSDGHLAVESGFLRFIVTPRGKTTGRHVEIRYMAAWEKEPDGRWLTRTWLESPAPAAPKTP
jgi:ketosteroid isomerase-like protein